MSKIFIGNQSAYSAVDLMAPFDYAIEHGFSSYEWFPDKKDDGSGWESKDIDLDTRKDIAKRGQEAGIRQTLHVPWWASIFDAEGRAIMMEELDFAVSIGADLLNLHMYVDKGLDEYVECLKPIARKAGPLGVTLAIENTPMTSPESFNELFELWNQTEESKLCKVCMCFDVGHANLFSETMNDYIAYLNRLSDQVWIGHIHMHENYGDSDSHLTIFTGPARENDTGIKMLLEGMLSRGFEGSIVLEQWPQPAELLLEARHRLEGLLEPLTQKKKSSHPSVEVESKSSKTVTREVLTHGDVPSPESLRSNASHCSGICEREWVKVTNDLGSWRKRLIAVGEKVNQVGTLDEVLNSLSVYLKILGLGQLPCVEDGGHHRPNHSAKAAQHLLAQLSQRVSPWEDWRLRHLLSWLPSFDSQFTCAEPLTRIRDLAHRNDIDQHLKREIKTQLQNKLHRSAGPEDLITAEAFLKRFQSGETYVPDSFMHEYLKFMDELRDFFGAASLHQLLSKVQGIESEAMFQWLEHSHDILKGLSCSLMLRQELRAKEVDFSESQTQDRLLCDLALEKFLFSTLSSQLEGWSSDREFGCRVLEALLPHVALSGSAQVLAVGERPDEKHPHAMLAWIQRVGLACEAFAAEVFQSLQPSADQLIPALGLADHIRETFAEGEVRSGLMFQVSKLASVLERNFKQELDCPDFDALSIGIVVGEAVRCQRLGDHVDAEQAVIWLDQLEGDEAIADHVVALIVGQPLPRLSHIAIRARQQGVVMLCLPKDRFEASQSWLGQSVQVKLASTDFEITAFDGALEARVQSTSRDSSAVTSEVLLTGSTVLMTPDTFECSRVGAKAQGAALLEQVAKKVGFSVPASWALPYATLKKALDELGCKDELQALFSNMDRGEDLFASRQRCKEIYRQASVALDVFKSLSSERRYAVRSSSNCEDLSGQSGAGWHSSVLGVRHADLPEACATVWASLWNEAGVQGRRSLGIPQGDAQMAILIQEVCEPEWSFICHTQDPDRQEIETQQSKSRNSKQEDSDEKAEAGVAIEMAHGLGEILTSASQAGQPYSLTVEKDHVKVLHYGTYLERFDLGEASELKVSFLESDAHHAWQSPEGLSQSVLQIATCAKALEDVLGEPQDIEGCCCDGQIFIVQTRPQLA